jgi:hypothetical protein
MISWVVASRRRNGLKAGRFLFSINAREEEMTNSKKGAKRVDGYYDFVIFPLFGS